MNYLRWTIGQDIAGRFPNRGVTECYTEIDESGRVTREIGVDARGVVVRLAPTPDDPYGLFDNQVVDMVQRRDDIAPEAFERLWRSHDLVCERTNYPENSSHSTLSSVWLAVRSLLWTVLFPGFFAGYVPWRFFGLSRVHVSPSEPVHLAGLVLTGAGAVLLAACIVEFARGGRGTLSPVDPPRHLVVRGLYRYVRNPMYLSVTAIVLGEVALTRSTALAVYWAVWFACVNVFVIGYEEPTLRRQFGASYEEYVKRVGRWVPRSPRTSTTETQRTQRPH